MCYFLQNLKRQKPCFSLHSHTLDSFIQIFVAKQRTFYLVVIKPQGDFVVVEPQGDLVVVEMLVEKYGHQLKLILFYTPIA